MGTELSLGASAQRAPEVSWGFQAEREDGTVSRGLLFVQCEPGGSEKVIRRTLRPALPQLGHRIVQV